MSSFNLQSFYSTARANYHNLYKQRQCYDSSSTEQKLDAAEDADGSVCSCSRLSAVLPDKEGKDECVEKSGERDDGKEESQYYRRLWSHVVWEYPEG